MLNINIYINMSLISKLNFITKINYYKYNINLYKLFI